MKQVKQPMILLFGVFLINVALFLVYFFFVLPLSSSAGGVSYGFIRGFQICDSSRVLLCVLWGWYAGGGGRWKKIQEFRTAFRFFFQHYGSTVILLFLVWFFWGYLCIDVGFGLNTLHHVIWGRIDQFPFDPHGDVHIIRRFLSEALCTSFVWFGYVLMTTLYFYRRSEQRSRDMTEKAVEAANAAQ